MQRIGHMDKCPRPGRALRQNGVSAVQLEWQYLGKDVAGARVPTSALFFFFFFFKELQFEVVEIPYWRKDAIIPSIDLDPAWGYIIRLHWTLS